MILTLLLALLAITSSAIRYSFLPELIFLTKPLHETCLNLLPHSLKTTASLQALVCGRNFQSLEAAKIYTSAGLIHLFVVSGSHLILIHKFIEFIFVKLGFKKAELYGLLVLFFYAAICEFNAPVTRSFIGLVFVYRLKMEHKYWHKDFVLMIVGFFCLILCSTWVHSLSLQMSWLAALGIIINDRTLKYKNKLMKQLPFYILYSLTFSCLGFPQVCTVVIALFFTPVLEFILLPLAFLVLLFPFLNSVFEVVLNITNQILSKMELSTSTELTNIETTIFLNWIFILSLHIYLYFNRKKT